MFVRCVWAEEKCVQSACLAAQCFVVDEAQVNPSECRVYVWRQCFVDEEPFEATVPPNPYYETKREK